MNPSPRRFRASSVEPRGRSRTVQPQVMDRSSSVKPTQPMTSADRAKMRLERLKILEAELKEEDKLGLVWTEDQRSVLDSSVAGVKADFQDLDGRSWTQHIQPGDHNHGHEKMMVAHSSSRESSRVSSPSRSVGTNPLSAISNINLGPYCIIAATSLKEGARRARAHLNLTRNGRARPVCTVFDGYESFELVDIKEKEKDVDTDFGSTFFDEETVRVPTIARPLPIPNAFIPLLPASPSKAEADQKDKDETKDNALSPFFVQDRGSTCDSPATLQSLKRNPKRLVSGPRSPRLRVGARVVAERRRLSKKFRSGSPEVSAFGEEVVESEEEGFGTLRQVSSGSKRKRSGVPGFTVTD